MKNLLFFIGVVSLALMIGSCYNRGAKKAYEDSIHRVDSLAQVETIRQAEKAVAKAVAEQARLDSIRQDSIRQDSIAKEEKMKLGQLSFISHNGDWKKILPKFGFKLISKNTYTQPSDYDEDEIWVITNYVYSRNLNGRKVTFKFSTYDLGSPYCATMIIHNEDERKRFIEDVKRLNKMKEFEEYGYIWKSPYIDHYISYTKGEFWFDTDH